VKELVLTSARWLEGRGVEEARVDAELLVASALARDRLGLWLVHDMPVNEALLAQVRELMRRRGAGEPVAYILGEREFHGFAFRVTPATLIPRPETEHLVDEALALLPPVSEARPRVIDLGTGTGCIAIVLAARRKDLQVAAVDVSPEALAVAEHNARVHGVQVAFSHADMLEHLDRSESYDLVLSNPPYITSGERSGLQREVRDWEPAQALFSGEDALHFHAAIAARLPRVLNSGGHALLELPALDGAGLVRAKGLGAGHGLSARFVNDLAGLPRVLVLSKP
jgi:release factor glutamine methyltransferase